MKDKTNIPGVAVIGMACCYPGAYDLRTLWENILSQRRQFRTFPERRLPLADYYDPDPLSPDKTYGTKAAFIDGFAFDWVGHRVPKSTFLSTDIAHWLALEVALQALADAGYDARNVPRETAGVILGNTLTGEQSRSEGLRLRWPFVRRVLRAGARARGLSQQVTAELAETMESYYKSVFAEVTEDTLSGSLSNTIAGRICNYLDLHGGGYTVDGACSSGLISVATASAALTNRDLDLVLAGGVDISLDTFELIGFAKVGALTKTDMHVYDRRGSGFIPGEGCGFVVLKRLDDAIRDGNYVYAVIRGWGISSDGKGGLTAPSVAGQAIALRRAYERAAVDPREIVFIEGHGTGTTVGDRVELEAISAVVGRDTKRSCGVTSLKSIIGHTKAASGIGGFIKTAIAVNRRVLPPTANCKEPHEVFDSSTSLYPLIHGEIRLPSETLKAGVSSMGFGGINCHVTLESADAPATKLSPSIAEQKLLVSHQTSELFVLSGNTPEDLLQRVRSARMSADGMTEGELVDLAAHLTRELDQAAPLRAALIAGSPDELLNSMQYLEEMIRDNPMQPGGRASSPRNDILLANKPLSCRIGFLFPGQGSQHLNMTRFIAERHDWAQALVRKADTLFRNRHDRTLSDHVYKDAGKTVDIKESDHWASMLKMTSVSQPAICLSSLLWLKELARLGITPAAVGGHSLGELTAFHAAGAFNEEALLNLAILRGEAMGTAGPEQGAMAGLSCSYEAAADIVRLVGGYVIIANINSPNQMILSGEPSSIEKAVAVAEKSGIPTRILPVSNAFHSRFVTAAADLLRGAEVIPELLGNTKTKLYSCMSGDLIQQGVNLRNHFADQAISQVDFVSLVQSMARECDLLIEVGPGRVLSNLAHAICGPQGPLCLPVESKAGNDYDLNRVLGEYFVRGGTILFEALYEGRLVRPFVPASDRCFIENPCERPFADEPADLQHGSGPMISTDGMLQTIFGDFADMSPSVLSDYFLRRSSFICSVIKADLESHPQPSPQELPAPSPVDVQPVLPEKKRTLRSVDEGGRLSSIAGMLLSLVEKRTGFPEESLSMDLRLLDDLNLDSIKASELIASAASRLGLAGELNTPQFANATLSEIASALDRMMGEGLDHETSESPAFMLPDTAWVRNFSMKYVLSPFPSVRRNSDRGVSWVTSRVLILVDESESALARTIKAELAANGAYVKILFYSDRPLNSSDNQIDFTHYITILPRRANNAISPELRLGSMINRLRAAALLHAASVDPRTNATMAFVQFGGGVFGAEMQEGDIDQCCSTSFAASLHHERPQVSVKVVDFSPRLSNAVVSFYLLKELADSRRYACAGYDDQMIRRVPRPYLQEPVLYKTRAITWDAHDVVIVTGGAKGITAECAFAFAKATGVSMVLVGSSPHPDTKQGQQSDVARTLNRFSSEGLSCRYYSCDITDPQDVRLLVSQVVKEVGNITGVIHGAGLNRPNRIESVSEEAALNEIGPKLYGGMNLCAALQGSSIKLFVGLTSIIGITGMPGNAWYAFSNESLDVLLRKFEGMNPGSMTLSIAFSIWRETGMGARMGSVENLAKLGIGSIPTEEGVRRFVNLLLNDPGARQVIVTSRLGGLDTWTPERYSLPASRFLEHIITSEPNVEIISRTFITLERDQYVKDHLWRGTYLFPAVFGFEAMSQTVSYVTGITDFNSLLIENIQFDHPIMVLADNGCTIDIHAEVLEREAADDPLKVVVGIRCDQTGFSIDHFSATFVFAGRRDTPVQHFDLPAAPLDIEPQRDLYGGLLFQGPQYQRIKEIYAINSSICLFGSEIQQRPKISREFEVSSWLMGDPFFRDSLLHAVQIPISQVTCLPLKIDRLERFPISGTAASLFGIAEIERTDDINYYATVSAFDRDGTVVERISGYVLRIMEHHPEYPSAEEMADPGVRDEKIIRETVEKLGRQFAVSLPEIVSTHVSGIDRMSREERRQKELPLLQDALRRSGYVSAEVSVAWLESGKPVAKGASEAGSDVDVSLSHSEGTVLCVAGAGQQGCDIESVTLRSRDEWIALFGKKQISAFQQLIDRGESLDLAGTRIWTVIEALHKTGKTVASGLKIEKKTAEGVLFRFDSDNEETIVLTVPVRLTRGMVKMIAIIVKPIAARSQPARAEGGFVERRLQRINLEKLNFDSDFYKVAVSHGPQGQPLLVFQFPVTFKESSNPSKTLYFSHYFTWIGKLREFVIEPIYDQLVEFFATGKWGMVTNHAETTILGDAKAGDIIEGHVCFDRVRGKDNSTLDMRFEWWKKPHDGPRQRIAFSTMSTTWVAILGHGSVEVRPLPEFGREFLDRMLPHADKQSGEGKDELPSPSTDYGQELYREPAGPVQVSSLLSERIFETTLEDANLVGNIYFSNYYLWQGRVRDQYLNEVSPEYFNGSGGRGELRCRRCIVNHINEAMPFEKIAVRMHRASVFEKGIKLHFDYYRISSGGELSKLGFGQHDAIWHSPNDRGEWVPSALPPALMEALVPQEALPSAVSADFANTHQHYDVIVIGAGIGGLTAAALLAKQGKRVMVVEQHNRAGGFCTSWQRRVKVGDSSLCFVFDAGVHDILGVGPNGVVAKLLDDLGISDKVEWLRMGHAYITPHVNLRVSYTIDEYINLLADNFPHERNGIHEFFKVVSGCYHEFYNKALVRQFIPKWINVPFITMLHSFIKDPDLRVILSVLHHYIGDDISKVDTMTMIPLFGYYFEGGFYPRGGSQVFADVLEKAIKDLGGDMMYRSSVSRIVIENGHAVGVQLANGNVIRSEIVISNADVRKTFLELVGEEHVDTFSWQRIQSSRPSNSAFMVSLGIDFIPNIEPITLVFSENRDIAVMAPSIVDRSLAPKGHACLNILTLISRDEAVTWKRDDSGYAKRKAEFGDALISLAEKIIPNLRAHIIFRQDASPATFGRYAATSDGAIYGLAAGEWRPSARSRVQGLFMVGAGTMVRPGVGDAVHSGMLVANAVLKASSSVGKHVE